MSFRSQLGSLRARILSSAYQRNVHLGGRGPIISFTFDDFPRTAYGVGGSILEAFGARGTYYAAASLMNTSGELGEYFRPADLQSLTAKGHDLGSHTFRHVSCRSTSASSFRNEVASGSTALVELTGVPVENFAYPFGHATLGTKKLLGPTLASSRGIIPGLNGPEVDLNLLRANRLYGDVDQAGTLQALIQENVRQRSWLIFYTHDVRSNPSQYGCTPELFESVVSCATKSGSRILTVQQVLEELVRPAGLVHSAHENLVDVPLQYR